ncbi:MAG: hypothetical protein AAF585_17735 [Verrucomicrobiota bacterium]
MKCFRCEAEFEKPINGRCPECGWGDFEVLEESDPRYLVFEALMRRALSDGERVNNKYTIHDGLVGYLKITPTAREYALFEHGTQCYLENMRWRITAKSEGVLYMRGWQVGKDKNGRLVEVAAAENLEEKIKERNEQLNH